ncbi:endo-1,4-beta-xylanase [Shewanella donghaensis]|uniref:endo-1,4-beta-xylanase n=1 Tax=Shewanella donghaensis TaxID=238836 RepID=UPI001184423E|nr:endo-1,4-beta-xylanase [Shewanella donghaensis]
MNIKNYRSKLKKSTLLVTPLLLLLSACSDDTKPIVPPTVVEDPEPEPIPPESLVTNLVEAAEKANKRIGTALSHGVLSNNETDYIDIVRKEFNYVTPENIGKWGSIQNSSSDVWDFDALDSMIAFVEENNIAFKGHALVWHRQAPSFVNGDVTPEDLTMLINAHIDATAARYSGQIYAWDVANEVMGDDANYRNSVFFEKLDKNYIAYAFTRAHDADLEAKLFYNDYSIDNINSKSDAVLTMVTELIDAEVPIHGVGFQMHLDASNAPSTQQMTDNLQRFADLDLDVNISEIDVRLSSLPWNQVTKLAIQQQVYHRAVNACMNVDRCDAVTVWGFTDKYSWIDGEFGPDDPLLYTADYERKPAYFAIADGFVGIQADAPGVMPNLIANGNFEIGTDGWTTLDETALRTTEYKQNGITSLLSTASEDAKATASIDITSLLKANSTYDLEAWVMSANEKTLESAVNVMLQCVAEEASTIAVNSAVASNTEFTQLSGSFTAPDCELVKATLSVEGPEISEDLYLDTVSLRPQALMPNTDGFGDNLLANSDFEVDTSGWEGYDTSEVSITATKVFAGTQSLVGTARTQEYQGPSTNILSLIEPGQTYQLFAQTAISEGSAQVKATISATCSDGVKYLGTGATDANSSDWSLIAGQVTLPTCAMSDAILYFEGPAVGIDIYIDNVTFHQQAKNLGPNLVANSDFEVNTEGWSVWGGVLASSTNFANTGNSSALHSDRTGTWQGPIFDLLPYAETGNTYEIETYARIENAEEDLLNITLKTLCEGDVEADASYTQHGMITATNDQWSKLNGNLVLPDCVLTSAFIYFDGPAIGVDIYIDSVSITSEITVDVDNLFTNSTFESGINGWATWGANIEESTEFAHTGDKSALVNSRTNDWQGPVFDFIGKGVANTTYDMSGWIRVAGSESENVSINIKQTCENEAAVYTDAGPAVTVSDSEWTLVSGTFTTADCVLTELAVYFSNAAVGVDIYLDDAVLKLAPIE